MSWVLGTAEFGLLALLLLAALCLAGRRASRDWTYQLGVTRTLAVVAGLEVPGMCAPELFEVVLVEPRLYAGSFSIGVSLADGPGEVGLLVLDAPVGERVARLVAWRDHATPLLCCGIDSAQGCTEAVLYGPDGFVSGELSWQSPLLLDSASSW